MKSVALLASVVGLLAACNHHEQPAPTEGSPQLDNPGANVSGEPSSSESVEQALSPPPPALDVESWHRIPGLAGIALRNCALLSDGFTRCAFTGENGFEARILYRTYDSNATTQFECELRAGEGAGATLTLGAGFSRWEARGSVLAATDSLCFSTQVFQNGALDRDESLRVGTELAENAVSLDRAEIPPEAP